MFFLNFLFEQETKQWKLCSSKLQLQQSLHSVLSCYLFRVFWTIHILWFIQKSPLATSVERNDCTNASICGPRGDDFSSVTIVVGYLVLKGIVLPKMTILSFFTHPHVIPNPLAFHSQVKIFLMKLERFLSLHSTKTLTLLEIVEENHMKWVNVIMPFINTHLWSIKCGESLMQNFHFWVN